MPSDFSRIRDNVQKMVDQYAPAEDIDGYLGTEGFTPNEFKQANENYGTFVSAIKRGGKSTGSLIADFLPAMGADLLGKIAPESWKPTLEKYKEKQMAEAQKTQQEMKLLPAEYESAAEVKDVTQLPGYFKEAIGEAIPSMLPGVVTGGVGAVAGRGAIAAAGEIAGSQAAKSYLTSQAAKNVAESFAKKRAAEIGLEAATSAMTKKALQIEAGSALLGSAALNMPDAYQAVYDPNIQDSLMPALASGAFNSVLDAITPFNLLRRMKAGKLNPTAVAGAWYKQGAKELGKGFLTEGATEALQEMSNAKAEQFVKNNPEFFTPENLMRFLDAGLKGGIGGGAIQGGLGALTSKNVPAAPKTAPQAPAAPGATEPTTPISAYKPGTQTVMFGPEPEGKLPERTEPVFAPGEAVITPEGIDTGKIKGYREAEPLPPEQELTGEQGKLGFPGQQELFEGQAPVQPEKSPAEVLKNVEGEPAGPIAGPAKPISVELQDVVKAAKEDPTASKILKGNNAASAEIVAERVQALMATPDADPIAAMEALYLADKTGKYPAGTKPLSDAQNELLQTAYRRLTGKDIETAIKDRALQGAQQAELFPQGAQNEAPVQVSNEPGAAPTNVGIPPVGGEPGSTAGVGGPGEPGLAGGQPAVGGAPSGTQTKPVALNPSDAWEIHRDADQPTYADLSPEEQAAWNAAVAANRGNAVNFQDVLGAYTQRTEPTKPKTPGKTVPIPQGAVSTETNIAAKVRGLQAAQAAAWIADNGPAAYRDVARQVEARLKEYKKLGFKISVRVLSDAEGARLLRSGTAGIARHSWGPGTWETKIELPPSSATFETVLHELLHSVTTPAIMYVEKGRLKGSNLSQFYKDLEEVAQYAWAELKNRVENGQPTPFEVATYRDMNNAFGSSERNRENMVREVISWSMTNPEMQAFLESVPYKGKNLFTKFVEAFRTFLGLTPKADTALSEILRATEGILNIPFSEMQKAAKEGRYPLPSGIKTANTPRVTETLTERVAISPQTIISSPPKPLTQLQAAQTAGQKTQATAKKIYNTMNDEGFWTSFRIAAIDKVSGLTKTLSSLPVFQNGQLRADMLIRSFQQVINLIKNGIQTGIPIVNADGSVVIMRSDNNLARSQILADQLDGNALVQSSGYSGRQFVAEVARALRGEEIMREDAARRSEAERMMLIAKAKMAQARSMRKAGASLTEILKLVNEAKAIRNEYRDDLTINRERQVTQEHIDWAKASLNQIPEVGQILDMWRNINMGLIDLWENAGLLAEGQAEYYRKKKSYVPLFASRVDLSPDQQETYTGKGTGTKTVRQLEHLEGNSELLRNIWENLDKHYANMTAAAFQNQTRKIAVSQLMSAGIDAARYAKRDDPDVNLRFKDPSNPYADKDGVVSVILDNPNDLAAFQMLSYELGPLMRGLSATTQVLRAGALINPMYWIKQLIRDPIHAALVSNSGIVTPFHAAKEYINILANNSEEAKLLASRGVIGQVDSTMDIYQFLNQVGTEKANPSKLAKMMHNVMRMHEASDAATRVAIYKKAYQEAIDSGMSKEDAVNLAVHKARESINFATRGNSKTLNALRHMIPFFSASLTSIDTLFRAATGYGLNAKEKAEARTLFAKRAAMMTILSTAYAMMMQDDDDYKKLPDNVKDNNWLFPSPIGSEHTFVKIPVPFEVGFFFKTIPEASVRFMAGTSTGKEVLASVLLGIQHNLPGEAIPLPQMIKPGIEAVTNYSFFTGRPIEGMSDQGLPVEFRGAHASELAKTLSSFGLKEIGLSPAKIDHLIQGYMAELGTFSSNVAGSAINAATGKEPPAKNLEQEPFFKAFLTNPNTSKAATDYYEISHQAQETVNAFNRFKKEGRVEEAQAMLQDEDKKKLMMAAPALRRVQEQMAKIRATMNVIEQDQKRSPEERRDEINRLQGMYDRVARQGVALADKLEIPR